MAVRLNSRAGSNTCVTLVTVLMYCIDMELMYSVVTEIMCLVGNAHYSCSTGTYVNGIDAQCCCGIDTLLLFDNVDALLVHGMI